MAFSVRSRKHFLWIVNYPKYRFSLSNLLLLKLNNFFLYLFLRELLDCTTEGEVGVTCPLGNIAGKSDPGNPWLLTGSSLIAGVLLYIILNLGRILLFPEVTPLLLGVSLPPAAAAAPAAPAGDLIRSAGLGTSCLAVGGEGLCSSCLAAGRAILGVAKTTLKTHI